MLASGCPVASAQPPNPQELFDKAIQLDLEGDRGAASAFTLFRQAAEAGIAPAEFTVAVMLDSGRGALPDPGGAALWYARAAARHNQRAAFNLGQLYEAGEGVPRNIELARAWFDYSNLPAGHARAARLPRPARRDGGLVAPVCADPASNTRLPVKPDGVEFVWTSDVQPEPVRFFIEVRNDTGQEVYSSYSTVSSALVPFADRTGRFSWRVSAVSLTRGRYSACDWSGFTLSSD